MPLVDYADYAQVQSEWAYSLLRKATKSDRLTAEDLGKNAKRALDRIAQHNGSETLQG